MEEQIPFFMQITGCVDVETALQYIEVSDIDKFGGGELETAVSLYLESGGQQKVSSPVPPIQNEVEVISEVTRAPIQSRREVLSDFIQGTRIPFPNEGPMDPFRNSLQESRMMQTEADPIWQENDRLARLFEPPTELTFKGTFDMARTKAREENKWLLVSIHDPAEFPCQVLNRDLWKSEEVKEFIKEAFVFVQV
jgi:hypothetical protein